MLSMQFRIVFHVGPVSNNIVVELVPSRDSSNLWAAKFAQRMEVEPKDENSRKRDSNKKPGRCPAHQGNDHLMEEGHPGRLSSEKL